MQVYRFKGVYGFSRKFDQGEVCLFKIFLHLPNIHYCWVTWIDLDALYVKIIILSREDKGVIVRIGDMIHVLIGENICR